MYFLSHCSEKEMFDIVGWIPVVYGNDEGVCGNGFEGMILLSVWNARCVSRCFPRSRVYVVGFAKFATEVFFLLAGFRGSIDVSLRVYVVLGNLFVRIGIGFASFISAAAVCTDLTFVVNVSQTVFPALNQDARLKRANLTNPGPRLWSWRQMFLPTFVCRVFRLQVDVVMRCLTNRVRALLNAHETEKGLRASKVKCIPILVCPFQEKCQFCRGAGLELVHKVLKTCLSFL